MKIALIGKYGEGEIVGGPERVARELFSELVKHNSEVTFIEYFFGGYSDYSFLKKIVGRKIISQNIFRLGIIRIIRLIIKEKYDIVHLINIQRFQLVIFLLKYFLETKIISTFHGISCIELKGRKNFLQKRYFLDVMVEKFLIKKSDLIIFPSELLFNQFQKSYRISKDKAIVIPNGINNIFIIKESQFSFNGKFNIVFYNGFNSLLNRGLDKIIEELSVLKNLNINLFVLGHSDIRFKSQGSLNIIFVKFLNQKSLIDFCSDKQFIIKSSTFDSFPILVLECMALGLIPIITNNIGVKDYIINGHNGFIYEPEVQNSLNSLIEEIIQKKYDLNLISENTKETAKQFNWKEITKKYLAAYHKVQ